MENCVEHEIKPPNNNGKYFCNICGVSFKRKDRLDRHMFIHTGERSFKCNLCDKSYISSCHLKRHKVQSHEEKQVRFFSCGFTGCGQTFTSMQSLNRHKPTHERSMSFACHHCEKAKCFKRKHQFKRHLMICHEIGEYSYKCDVCGVGFFKKYAYQKHIAKKHCVKKCQSCERVFVTWTQLLAHRKEVHPKKVFSDKPFQCDLCGKEFYRKDYIRRHMKIHTMKDIMFPCSVANCSKFYTNKRNLNAHVRSKHEGSQKKFLCHICNVTLSTSQKLREHLLVHADPERSKNLKQPSISVLLGIKVQSKNTSQILFSQMKQKVDVLSTESEFSDNN